MTCYNPAACKHVSNCSSTPTTACEPFEHQLELLDTYFVSIRDQWCKGITCCEIVPCSVFVEPPAFPPAFAPADEWFYDNMWVPLIFVLVFLVTVFLVTVSLVFSVFLWKSCIEFLTKIKNNM